MFMSKKRNINVNWVQKMMYLNNDRNVNVKSSFFVILDKKNSPFFMLVLFILIFFAMVGSEKMEISIIRHIVDDMIRYWFDNNEV